jgi:hypothetical protein
MTAAKKAADTGADGTRPGEDGRVSAAELELARQLAERVRAEGLSLTGPGGLLGRLTMVVLEGRPGGRDGRPPRVCQARSGRAGRREIPQRAPGQDRAHRRGAGGGRGAAGRGRQLRPG